jgi:hypothetical protein
MNGFPTYASDTYIIMMKNVHWGREAIHNSVPIVEIRLSGQIPQQSHKLRPYGDEDAKVSACRAILDFWRNGRYHY